MKPTRPNTKRSRMMKITLFFCAGAVLVRTHKTQIESLRGFVNVMPFTVGVYTVAALALMGTPLLPGFVSKWMIGSAAVSGGLSGFREKAQRAPLRV